MKQLHRTVAIVLLALAVSSLWGTFPHDHARPAASLSCQKSATHQPHHDARLESDGFRTHDSSCAICFFQRTLSQASASCWQLGASALSHAPLSVSSESIVLAEVAFVAEPRAPPVT